MIYKIVRLRQGIIQTKEEFAMTIGTDLATSYITEWEVKKIEYIGL